MSTQPLKKIVSFISILAILTNTLIPVLLAPQPALAERPPTSAETPTPLSEPPKASEEAPPLNALPPVKTAPLTPTLLLTPTAQPGRDVSEPPAPPNPNNISPEADAALARQAIQAVVDKYLRYQGVYQRTAAPEPTVVDGWAKATLNLNATRAANPALEAADLTVLARRLPDGTWQALLPDGDGLYRQWLDAVPESLVSVEEKGRLRIQTRGDFLLIAPETQPNTGQHDIQFHKQGFSVSIPLTWYAKTDNSFDHQLPKDTVILSMSPTSFDISIVPVQIENGLRINTEVFAQTVFGMFRGIPHIDDLTINASRSRMTNSTRHIVRETSPNGLEVVSVSEFIMGQVRGYWLSTSYYVSPGSSTPLYTEGSQRLKIFEELVNSFQLIPLSNNLDTTITAQNIDEINNTMLRTRSPQSVNSTFTWPTTGYIYWLYQQPTNYGPHNGVDIWTSTNCNETSTIPGNSVYPVASGNLDYRYPIPGRGVYDGVRIDYGIINGAHIWTHYWHLGSLDQTGHPTSFVTASTGGVDTNTIVGYQGNLMRTNNNGGVTTTCVHLHITVANGNADRDDIDPSPYFDTTLYYGKPGAVPPGTYVEHTGGGSSSPEVVFYFDQDYGGNEAGRFGVGRHNDINPTHNSVRVPDGWSVKVWINPNYSGQEAKCYNTDNHKLTDDGLQNQIRSLEVFDSNVCQSVSNPEVKLFSDENYAGNVVFHSSGGFSNLSDTHVNSMQLPAGWSVDTWRERDKNGEMRCWNESIPKLIDHGWQYGIQSIEVYNSNVCAPNSPPIISPANGTRFTVNSLQLDWGNVSGAVEYHVQVATDSNFNNKIVDAGALQSDSYDISSLSNGTYYWHVQAKSSSGRWSGYSSTWNFTIDVPPVCATPGSVSLVSPSNGETTTDNTPTLMWNAVSNAGQYRLRVGNDVYWTTNLSYTLPPLSDGVHSWEVTGHNNTGGCNELGSSSRRTFTIDTTPPAVPTLYTPSSGATVNVSTPSFDWNSPSGASGYHIQIDDNSTFATPVRDTYPTNSNYTPASSLSDGAYYWRVQAKDSLNNWSSWSSSRSFTIDTTPPGPPNDDFDGAYVITDISYNNSQNVVDATTAVDDPIFTCTTGQRYNTVWYQYTPPTDGTLNVNTFGSDYDTVLAIWTGSRGSLQSVGCNDQSGGNQSQVDVSVSAGTTYYIEIANWSSSAAGTLNISSTLTPACNAPSAPSLLWPDDGITISDNRPTFISLSNGQIQIADNVDFNNPVISDTAVYQYYPPFNMADNTYYWRGRRLNSDYGCHIFSPWSETWSFTINTDNTGPGNNNFDTPLIITTDTSFDYTQSTVTATTAIDDPTLSCLGTPGNASVWYQYTPYADGNLRIDTATTGGTNYNSSVALWSGERGNLQEVACSTSDGSPSGYYDDGYIRHSFVQRNTPYHIEIVGDEATESGSVDLRLSFEPTCNDNYEPLVDPWGPDIYNNTYTNATVITVGNTITATICGKGDYDWYKFTGQAGDRIVADIDAAINGSWLDSVIDLYDTDGQSILAENDDAEGSFDSKLGYELPADGTYYLRVRDYRHPNVGGSLYAYDLTISIDDTGPEAQFITPSTNWMDTTMQSITIDASDIDSGVEHLSFWWHSSDWVNDDWQHLGWDYNGSDGWGWNFDTSSLPEQNDAAFYVYAYDWAGNYTGSGFYGLGIDRTPPTTTVAIQQMLGSAPFRDFWVTWWNSYDTMSGIASYDIQYRDGAGGVWTDLITDTLSTYTRFVGQDGHTYYFRSRARDNSGNQSAYAGGDGDTQHTVAICAVSPDAYEGDNDVASATSITPSLDWMTHTIHIEADQDWLQFSGVASTTYVLETRNTGGHADTIISVYDTDGTTLLASNDDAPDDWPASWLRWTPDHSGIFYMKVEHWDQYAYGCTTEYTVRVRPAIRASSHKWQQTAEGGFGTRRTEYITSLAGFNTHLYAGAYNPDTGAQLWRTGSPWRAVTNNGFDNPYNQAIDHLIEFKGKLYAGTWADDTRGGEIWRTADEVTWTRVISGGFGDPTNAEVFRFAEFNNQLYASTWSYTNTHGSEIWRSSSGDSDDWTRVVSNGFGDANNESVLSIVPFNNALYASTYNTGAGGEVWRAADGASWTQINDDGFGYTDTAYIAALAVFDGALYAGATNYKTGGQLWRCALCDGSDWEQMVADGFGDVNNKRIDGLVAFDGRLYAVTANFVSGIEIWFSEDGATWEQLNADGFGDSANTAPYWNNSTAVLDNTLYVGTWNKANGGEVWQRAAVETSVANFTASPVAGDAPLTVNFTNTSTGDYTTSQWDFGDGGSSSQANPSHAYNSPGAYTVILTVSGTGGTDVMTRVDYIAVDKAGSSIYLPLVLK